MKIIKFVKRRWYLVLILISIFGLIAYRQNQAAQKKLTENSYTVKRQNVQETLSFSGEIDADEKATLQFPLSGKLAWLGVKEGDQVKRGQTIARLDQTEAKKNLEKALRDYSNERDDFEETYRVTYRAQTPSTALTDTVKRILEKNQWDLEKAVLDVELKDYTLKLSTLTSPIDGMVTHIDNLVSGLNIVYTTSTIDVINPESLYFSATADQTDIVKLTNGQKGTIVFDPYPDEEIDGTINSIAFTPKENETGTVYEIKISFPNQNNNFKYRLGMTGDISFVLKERPNILAVPTNIIKTEEDKKYVLKLENNKKVKTYIQAGEEIDSQTEITSGLADGDVIYYD